MECNRAAVTCGDGKYLAKCMPHTVCSLSYSYFISTKLFIKHVHAILIALMVVKDATTQFASAM